MKTQDALALLPETAKSVVVILSGGMDSTIATRLAVEKYGKDKVKALSFDYGQKQKKELYWASLSCEYMQIPHKVSELSFLNDFSQGVSANVDTNIQMPRIQDVLGDPAPKTEVPFRNTILLAAAASYAQQQGASHIICGLQVHDAYGYWDTTQSFIDKMNAVLSENRMHKIKIIAPFAMLSKFDELNILKELNDLDLLKTTLTCYNPDINGNSCGVCPSCAERIMNFAKAGIEDPISYQKHIPWAELIRKYK